VNGLPPAGSQQSLETARLSLKPCSPAHILALIEQPPRVFLVHHGIRVVIGSAGFKGPPDSTGTVEIAYGIAPSFQGQGYATEAAGALVALAFEAPLVELVRAHTLPAANASTRVLVKCGFRHVGGVVDPEDGPVWRWERGR